MFGGVGVVVANAGPEVAAGLVEAATQDPRTRLDVGAEVVAQRQVGGGRRGAPMAGDCRNPDRVDLHWADVDGAVAVRADLPQRAAFDRQQDQHDGGRQAIGRRGGLDAADHGNRRRSGCMGHGGHRRQRRRQGGHRPHGRACARAPRAMRSSVCLQTRARSLTSKLFGCAACSIASITHSMTMLKAPAWMPRTA